MKFPVRMVGKHGAMHAYSTSEVAQLQSLGWAVEVTPAENLKAALAESMRMDPPPSAPDEPLVTEPLKRKPGRPAKAK